MSTKYWKLLEMARNGDDNSDDHDNDDDNDEE